MTIEDESFSGVVFILRIASDGERTRLEFPYEFSKTLPRVGDRVYIEPMYEHIVEYVRYNTSDSRIEVILRDKIFGSLRYSATGAVNAHEKSGWKIVEVIR